MNKKTARMLCIGAAAAAAAPLFLIAPGAATRRQKAPFYGLNFAHRGLHSRDKAVPENSLEAFRLAAEAGYGVELSIDGIDVVFAEKDFLASRGVQLPEDSTAIGQVFYMVVAGKVMGKVVISSDVNDETENLVPEMKAVGISRCILLTDDSKEAGQQFAELMNFNEMYPQCSGDNRLELISDISSKAKTKVIFVYASGIECHSPASIDMRVGKKSKYADAIVDHEYINNIPFARQVAVRVREIAIENALFAFIVKALLIFLSIVGYCNLWFAIFIDFVAAVATILNTIRVTSESLITTLKYKSGK